MIVVDDGSTDDSPYVEERPEMAGGAIPLRLVRERHLGKGGAVRAGMLAARGEFVTFSDADLATPPDQLPLLVSALADHDLALGSRIQPDGSDRRSSQPFYRRLLGRVFHGFASAWITGPVPDTQCGFKGFRASVARDLFGRQRIDSIVFDAEIIHLARRRGYKIAIVPVQWSGQARLAHAHGRGWPGACSATWSASRCCIAASGARLRGRATGRGRLDVSLTGVILAAIAANHSRRDASRA